MMDPPRLLDQNADDVARSLLESVSGDVGSPRAQARCVAAAGATLVLTESTIASGALVVPALKAGVLGLALGALVTGAGVLVTDAVPAPAPVASSVLRVTPGRAPGKVAERRTSARHLLDNAHSPAESEPALRAEVRESSASSPPGNGRSAARPSEALERSSAGAAANPSPDRSLEREVAALDQARQALDSGDPDQTLRVLATYEREFPRGALRSEAIFLRVKALMANGRRAEASDLGRRFIAAHPSDAQARKIERILSP